MSHQRTWVVLVLYNADGTRFRRTAPHQLDIPVTAVVVNFRDAVKQSDGHMFTTVVAMALKVFKNQADLEADKPLEDNVAVKGMGVSEQEALLVLVPRVLIKLAPDVWIPLSSMFVQNQDNAQIVDVGPELCPLIKNTAKQIFVRQAYVKLFNMFYNEGNPPNRKVIATGSPGIGKKMFLIYCAFTLVTKHGKTVLLHISSAAKYLITPKYVQKVDPARDLDPEGQDWYYLADSIAPTYFDCKLTILTGCPLLTYARQYAKVARKFYMPLWDWKEIENMNASLRLPYDMTELKARFEILNGVPGQLFNTSRSAEDIVVDALENTCISDLMRRPDGYSIAPIVHVLVLFEARPDFSNYTARYGSSFVSEKVYDALALFGKLEMQRFILHYAMCPFNAGLGRPLYAYLANDVLMQGGDFKRRTLYEDNRQSEAESVKFPCASLVVKNFADLDEGYAVAANAGYPGSIYFRPKCECLVVDSWIQDTCMFQMTVRTDHKLNPLIHEVSAKCNSKVLYFVVASEAAFKEFSYVNSDVDSYHANGTEGTIEQHVLWVPPNNREQG